MKSIRFAGCFFDLSPDSLDKKAAGIILDRDRTDGPVCFETDRAAEESGFCRSIMHMEKINGERSCRAGTVCEMRAGTNRHRQKIHFGGGGPERREDREKGKRNHRRNNVDSLSLTGCCHTDLVISSGYLWQRFWTDGESESG